MYVCLNKTITGKLISSGMLKNESKIFCLLLLNFKSIEFGNHQIRCIVGKDALLKLK